MRGAGPSALLALAVALASGCGTEHPFSRGAPLEEELPDAGTLQPDAGEADAGEPDGGSPSAPTFRADVHPLLGACTACHADGAGGFRITNDADDDFASAAAKVDTGSPQASLLYTKPTNLVDHQGGRLWDPAGTEATTVLEWIRAGAKDD